MSTKFEGVFESYDNEYGDVRASIGNRDFCEEIYDGGHDAKVVKINGQVIAEGVLSASGGYCYSSWTHSDDIFRVDSGKTWLDVIQYLRDNHEGQNVVLEIE